MSQLQVAGSQPLVGKLARNLNLFVQLLPWLIIAAGVCLRLFHFWYNRSLYYDEAHIALNLIYRNFAGLASPPLYYDQQAPLGFLWAAKLITTTLGISEYALRLFPLICGLLSLPLFYWLVRRVLQPAGVNIALVCLAFAHPVVYHAVEVKQYETEMLATILAFLAYFRYKDRVDWGSRLQWGLIGASLVWFSLTSVFILAGVGITALAFTFREEGIRRSSPLLLTFSMWGISFILNYVFFISAGTEIGWLKEHWERQEAFMPFPPRSLSDVLWFSKIAFKALDYPLGLNWQFVPTSSKIIRFSLLGAGFFVVGLGVSFRRRPALFWLFFTPLFIALAASALKVYPLLERLLLFAAPLLIIFIAYGAEWVYSFARKRLNKPVALSLLVVFAAAPVLNSLNQLIRPKLLGGGKQIDLRQALHYVDVHRQPADSVFVTSSFENPYLYYKQLHRFTWNKLSIRETFDNLMPSNNLEAYKNEVRKSLDFARPGHRVWVILYPVQLKYLDESKRVQVTGYLVSDIVRQVLGEKGAMKDQYLGNNVELYLYQF